MACVIETPLGVMYSNFIFILQCYYTDTKIRISIGFCLKFTGAFGADQIGLLIIANNRTPLGILMALKGESIVCNYQ